MAPLPAGEMVRLWEQGRGQHPVDRALTLLEAADPRRPRAELATLRLGERDRRLLQLRQEVFGDPIDAQADCPNCGQRLEIAATVSQFLVADIDGPAPSSVVVEIGELVVEVRAANSRDFAAAVACGDVEKARRTLLERCVLQAGSGDDSVEPAMLPDEVAAEVSRVLSELDPQANILLDLRCPACDGEWQQPFDIGAFLWGEVAGRARRLLLDVHTLAWAYGWSEREVLALSDARRRFYLEQVEQWQTT